MGYMSSASIDAGVIGVEDEVSDELEWTVVKTEIPSLRDGPCAWNMGFECGLAGRVRYAIVEADRESSPNVCVHNVDAARRGVHRVVTRVVAGILLE